MNTVIPVAQGGDLTQDLASAFPAPIRELVSQLL